MRNDAIPKDAEHEFVLSGLIRKRTEIAGQIEHSQREVWRLLAELDHLDASIRVFNPGIDLARVPAKPLPPP